MQVDEFYGVKNDFGVSNRYHQVQCCPSINHEHASPSFVVSLLDDTTAPFSCGLVFFLHLFDAVLNLLLAVLWPLRARAAQVGLKRSTGFRVRIGTRGRWGVVKEVLKGTVKVPIGAVESLYKRSEERSHGEVMFRELGVAS